MPKAVFRPVVLDGWEPAAQSAAVPATSSRGIALKLRVTLRDAKETRDRALTIQAVEWVLPAFGYFEAPGRRDDGKEWRCLVALPA